MNPADVQSTRETISISRTNGAPEIDAETSDRFAEQDGAVDLEPPTDVRQVSEVRLAMPTLDGLLDAGIARLRRRHEGREKPIPLPWPSLASHFGGGLWPGVHFITASTGIGKSAFVLKFGIETARAGIPSAYVGLELDDVQIVSRVLGDRASIGWSRLYLGGAGDAFETAIGVAPELRGLCFHPYVATAHGWPASRLELVAKELRAKYPEHDGPGSRPALLVFDFLQIVGPEPDERGDLRERIARASYVCRTIATTHNLAVVVISGASRQSVKGLARAKDEAKLTWDEHALPDGTTIPIARRIGNPDALFISKESGDTEFSGDSVSVLFRATPWVDGEGCDVIFATPKGRATASTWSPLHFTGYGFEECADRGARVLETWASADDKRDQRADERRAKKDDDREARILDDAIAVARFVLANPNVSARKVRVDVLKDNSRRWTPAAEKLGRSLQHAGRGKNQTITVVEALLPADVRAALEVKP